MGAHAHRRTGDEAEAQLRASIEWAREQQAKSWELRSSTTLAELLIEGGRRDAARELLSPVYDWFTEGFETHDLESGAARCWQTLDDPQLSQTTSIVMSARR